MFGKKIEIGEGDKYDFTKVSTESVSQEEIAKKNAKLIEIFKAFDGNKDGKLDSVEMAQAMDAYNSLDSNDDDKLSKDEFVEAAKNFNENNNLTGKDAVDAKDLKSFIKNMFKATKGDPTEETQKVLAQYQREQEQLKQEEKQRQIEADAQRRGWEWDYDGAYWDKKTNKHYLPNAEGTAFEEVHWSDDEQKYKVMSAEELAALNAELEKQAEAEKKAKQPALEKYIVQPEETFTQVVTKALKAQGIENPTEEQIKEAKEQFKKDNPNAIKTTKDGYEYLLVGAEVNLRGKVESFKSSEEAIAQWAKDHPDEVSESYAKDHTELGLKPKNKNAATPEERATAAKSDADSIAPELTPKETLDEKLQKEAADIRKVQSEAKKAKESLDEILTHDWSRYGSSGFNNSHFSTDMIAYVVDDTIAERIDNVLGLDKKDVYEKILVPLMERAKEVGIDKKYTTFNNISDDLSLKDMQSWITALSNGIKAADKKTVDDAQADKDSYDNEQTALKKLNDNKELFLESNNSLARVVDLFENEPDSVEFGKNAGGNDYCKLPDGTGIMIERDDEGNISAVQIRNPGGPDSMTDVRYNSDGSVAFDPDGKSVDSGNFKEYVATNAFDFEKIKALAERIFGKTPKTEE